MRYEDWQILMGMMEDIGTDYRKIEGFARKCQNEELAIEDVSHGLTKLLPCFNRALEFTRDIETI